MSQFTSAKIVQHGRGMGIPDPDSVRQRAREIAIIAGRPDFSEADWQQALRELHGGHTQNDPRSEADLEALVSERDMVVSTVGHRVPVIGSDNDDNLGAELMAEGMDEALHEQMLAAREEETPDEPSEEYNAGESSDLEESAEDEDEKEL